MTTYFLLNTTQLKWGHILCRMSLMVHISSAISNSWHIQTNSVKLFAHRWLVQFYLPLTSRPTMRNVRFVLEFIILLIKARLSHWSGSQWFQDRIQWPLAGIMCVGYTLPQHHDSTAQSLRRFPDPSQLRQIAFKPLSKSTNYRCAVSWLLNIVRSVCVYHSLLSYILHDNAATPTVCL